MIKKALFFILTVLLAFIFNSCGEYQKVLKEDDTAKKYELAESLYKEGDYRRAVRLFEQIVPKFIGKPQGERAIFFFADSYYKLEDYYLAGYQFERFSKSYPRSDKAEEAAFYGAKSYYFLSPKFSIDQTETASAIDKLQNFINTYPNSERLSEANVLVKELRTKLERKAFEIAKQYDKIKDYYAAIKSFDLFLSDYPGTPYREDAMFYRLDSMFKLAINSIESKKETRLKEAKDAHVTLKKSYPESEYLEEADKMLSILNKELQQFSK
ncbi:outer membrane protein assembly factor BamD [Ascidiimonas sp. W6]|uniref:outer membrane protein assembly factor BamD n=1 Tax=Ascidiimonas meishanensis TaxID=3128903 RepID=UPI0030EE19EB